ncbi:sigma factor-like helix-turn-helix DNA-binding protein [Lachnospiraceae bacterium 56-18]|jgi:RNA polymerase sigma-70 factor (ECF subfamily)|uniref:sigma factor-like helix-turn-helix DNA-binding protein n=1 Tax=Sporofaciens sp. JLR.KK001 TaxID=3112621 RepID=UPI002FEFAAC8
MAKPGQKCSGFVLFGKGEEIQMKNMRTLTEEQKIFAEQHHMLVEQFLWKKHLERSEFYDVVIFGYLEAVQEYLEKPELSKYPFSSIAWRKMKYCMINEYIYRNCPKRNAPMGTYREDYEPALSREQVSEQMNCIARELEHRALLQQLMFHMTVKEKEVVCMRAAGYTYREIAEHCNITMRGVSARLIRMRKRFRALALI